MSDDLSRREFLAATAAAAVLGPSELLTPKLGPLDTFSHVVVLMMENRSFDNMLGYLYQPGSEPRGQHFEGVLGKDLWNPIPPGVPNGGRKRVPVQRGYVMDDPNPDPGEEYPHVNTQLFGTVLPETNRTKSALQMSPPFNAPAPIPHVPKMDGFVRDYINNFIRTKGKVPTYDEYRIIMNCFPPDAVPVISTLAKKFCVFDHWHCSVPSQTFCNRSFFNAGTSNGFVTNEPYQKWPESNKAYTIYQRLSEASSKGLTWKIYYDNQDIFPLELLIHFPVLLSYWKTNFAGMDQFYADVKNGTLPSYSFVEPRLFFNHNDQHPPAPLIGNLTLPSSVLNGEVLINNVYEAIRNSKSETGNNWQNTLFLLTYDEHGGCYDHVPPPAAVPPDRSAPEGQMGFRFDRAGIRVSTVVVSAYTRAGTIINENFEHTTMIKTLCNKWGLQPLTERDKHAKDLSIALNLKTPRKPDTWPVIKPRPLAPVPSWANDVPLNMLQYGIKELVKGLPGKIQPTGPLNTIGKVLNFFEKKVKDL